MAFLLFRDITFFYLSTLQPPCKAGGPLPHHFLLQSSLSAFTFMVTSTFSLTPGPIKHYHFHTNYYGGRKMATKIQWRNDLEEAKKEAQERGVPVLIDFFNPG